MTALGLFVSGWNLSNLECILSSMYYIVQSQETLEYLYSEQSDNQVTPKWTWEFNNAKHFDSFMSAASAAINDETNQTPVILSVAKANSVIWGIHYLNGLTE
jgi:hypothetical protein